MAHNQDQVVRGEGNKMLVKPATPQQLLLLIAEIPRVLLEAQLVSSRLELQLSVSCAVALLSPAERRCYNIHWTFIVHTVSFLVACVTPCVPTY